MIKRTVVTAAMLTMLGLLFGCVSLNAERQAPPVGQFIETDAGTVHVLLAGEPASQKPPIVFIHGASSNLRDMEIAFGNAGLDDRRLVFIDRVGHGYSARPKDGHRLSVQAGQINSALTALNIENPVIVGQSFGGAVALAYALDFQKDMAGLVLLAPVSHEWPGGIAWHNQVSQTPFIGFLLRRLVVPAYGQVAGTGLIERAFAPNLPPENYAQRAGVGLVFRPKEFRSNAADIFHLKSEVRLMQSRYGELDLPVAVVAGELDKAVSPSLHAKALKRQIPHAMLTMLPDTGHALHHAEPLKIADIINMIERQGQVEK